MKTEMPRLLVPVAVVGLLIQGTICQDPYVGKKIGKFNSYHHQVNGEVYAVDEHTFLIKNFMYDGNGKDTFFWAGSRPRPGPQGFIVPNEYGRTNVLDQYDNKDITIRLPEQRSIHDIKWLAVFDLTRLEPFGDVQIPDSFTPPNKITLNKLRSKSGQVNSGPVTIVDSKTILIEKLEYDGTQQDVYFWIGVGPQPHSRGNKVPDEHGYLTPLGRYSRKTIKLTLPGDSDVFTVDWLAIYNLRTSTVLGSVIIPDDLNVPPSLIAILPHENSMPNCEQLHKDLQVSWEIFGDQVTLEIAAQMNEDEYAAFGMSGSPTEPQMEGGDVVVVYRDGYLGYVRDYNLTSRFPCTELVGQHRGVCEDEVVGGTQDYQGYTSSRKDGLSIFSFRRRLTTPDLGDISYPSSEPAMIIWALGHLDEASKPAMHFAWSKIAQPISFKRNPAERNCYGFTKDEKPPVKRWAAVQLNNPSESEFRARLGPDGGPRGYSAITGQLSSTGLSWYINGFLAPEIILKRNTPYKFIVEGGSNPYDPATFHPLMITDEPHGGFSQLTDEQRQKVRVLAGVEYSVRGEVRSKGAGRLCAWQHPPNFDRRRVVDVLSFPDYRNRLQLNCDRSESARPGVLEVTPNKSWPDIVYYNSWTGRNMGWKIHIIDEAAHSGTSSKQCHSVHMLIFISLCCTWKMLFRHY